jgi:hypothetical protein
MTIDPSLRQFAAPRWTAWRIATAIALMLHSAAPSMPQLVRPGDGGASYQTDNRGAQLGAFRRAVPAIVKAENSQSQVVPKQWSDDDKPDALAPTAVFTTTHNLLAVDAADFVGRPAVVPRAFDSRAPPA